METPDVRLANEDATLSAFVDVQRAAIIGLLDGVTEEEARRRLVASRTTLLGIVKHCIRVEKVWFVEVIRGISREAQGLATGDDSFLLDDADTIASVRAAYETSVEESRVIADGLTMDDIGEHWPGGRVRLRWIHAHLIAEYARHAGHGDILREQILAKGR
jgi:hypothetical protein